MWTTSHACISIIIFGPTPEAVIGGAIIPDLFTFVNYFQKFIQQRRVFSNIVNDTKAFDDKMNTGMIWKINSALHSFNSFLLSLIVCVFFTLTSNTFFEILFGSFCIHLLVDFITHKGSEYYKVKFPFIKQKLDIGLFEYRAKYLSQILIVEFILILVALIRIELYLYVI